MVNDQIRVVWFWGSPDLKTKAMCGKLKVGSDGLTLHGGESRTLLFDEIQNISLGHAQLGTRILVEVGNERLSLMIPRLNIGGMYVIVNYVATRRLFRQIEEAWRAETTGQTGP